MKSSYEDEDVRALMAFYISKDRQKLLPKLVNGELVFKHKQGEDEAPTEFAGFDTLRRDDTDLIETWKRHAVERKSEDGTPYISYVTTYWIRSKGRPVIDKPAVLPGDNRDIPEWGVDQSALAQLLAYRYWKRSYADRMNRMRKSIQTYWLNPPESGIPQDSRRALDRFRDEGNDLLVRGQVEWHLDENAFRQRWQKSEQSGDVPMDDRLLLSQSSIFLDLWNTQSDWGVVSWSGFWSFGVLVDEADEILCTVAEMRWSREISDPIIRRTMLLHPLMYPALVLKSLKQRT
jgi:hypothetical protein